MLFHAEIIKVTYCVFAICKMRKRPWWSLVCCKNLLGKKKKAYGCPVIQSRLTHQIFTEHQPKAGTGTHH